MSDFLLFIADKQYTTEEGEPCTLGEHLDYVDEWSGTPDCWDGVDGSIHDAKHAARESGLDLYIVDASIYRVVAHEGV